LGYESKDGLIVRAISFQDFQPCGNDPPTSQTGQTDVVHRAVKMKTWHKTDLRIRAVDQRFPEVQLHRFIFRNCRRPTTVQ